MGTNARLCLAAAVAALVAVSATQGALMRWRFCITPKDTTAKVGERVVLHCDPPYGDPDPEVTWYKDGILLEGLVNEEEEVLPKKCEMTDDRIFLAGLGDLVIKAVEKTDAGLYVCKATNDAGERQTKPAYLTVMTSQHVRYCGKNPFPSAKPGKTIIDDLREPYDFDFSNTMAWEGISYKGKVFKMGECLELDNVGKPPSQVKFPSTLAGSGFCTLMMVDPDALKTSNPKYKSLVHWLVGNLPCKSGEVDMGKGDIINAYTRPIPFTGVQRYIFFVFRHEKALKPEWSPGRYKFKPEKFAVDHGLGHPQIATFFVTEKKGGYKPRPTTKPF